MQRPTDAIRIDDLAAPRHPPRVLELQREAAKLAPLLRYEPEPLCRQAADETGLENFGRDDFRVRLTLLLRALETEGELSPLGRVSRYRQLVDLLKTRLRVEDQIARHPEILEIEISRPIVITGFPRTGTTHLHNSLAADPELRFLPYWEALEPVLPDAEIPAPGQKDPRRARCEQALAFVNGAMPHFMKLHEMTVDHAHEEIDLLALDFSTMWFETPGPLWSWIRHYKASDQTPHYAYLKRVLQVLTFLRGGKRWVLKSPQHFEQLRALRAVFPDATLVLTHRDPLPVIASFATLMTYTARLAQAHPDPAAYGRYVVERSADLLDACLRDRALWPPERSIDLHFHELVADQDRAIHQLYARAGQPIGERSRRAISDYAESHPQGRHGKVRYDLADFGLEVAALRERFRAYTERFGVRLEH